MAISGDDSTRTGMELERTKMADDEAICWKCAKDQGWKRGSGSKVPVSKYSKTDLHDITYKNGAKKGHVHKSSKTQHGTCNTCKGHVTKFHSAKKQ